MKDLARSLRKNQTDAERVIWQQLRNRQLLGCKFRRQQVIGPFIVDFVCLEPKLVIEVDGGQHAEQQEYDQNRSHYLQRLGYRVLRFWNHEVLQNRLAVMEVIRLAVIELIEPVKT
ncbi:endonuclease domain-containing protein [Methylomonas sp. EFPC1]|uniref:endonuclease domain-containing protein n=1 Tax=Methylomonas sp. EFPC1 TaxID=2812647 RepID=UPI0019671542|nr:endonuclease domain-containing protein [Methylomonas sp. EFPC1]QSB01070.1 endonuclease domain-containing protein [Methylomonas sp. EFPC1]